MIFRAGVEVKQNLLVKTSVPSKKFLHWANVFLVRIQLRTHADTQLVKRFKRWKVYPVLANPWFASRMQLFARFYAALTQIPYLFVYKSQNFVTIVHLESRGATYSRIAWKRAWWLMQAHTHASASTRHTSSYRLAWKRAFVLRKNIHKRPHSRDACSH